LESPLNCVNPFAEAETRPDLAPAGTPSSCLLHPKVVVPRIRASQALNIWMMVVQNPKAEPIILIGLTHRKDAGAMAVKLWWSIIPPKKCCQAGTIGKRAFQAFGQRYYTVTTVRELRAV
jgi:hypothetical protein